MRSLKGLLALVLLLSLSNCATEIPDIWVNTYDPYSDTCYGATTVSGKERDLPPLECRRGVIIFSEDYAKLKKSMYKNCINSKCKQSVEVVDQLFIAIDTAFDEVYGK